MKGTLYIQLVRMAELGVISNLLGIFFLSNEWQLRSIATWWQYNCDFIHVVCVVVYLHALRVRDGSDSRGAKGHHTSGKTGS